MQIGVISQGEKRKNPDKKGFIMPDNFDIAAGAAENTSSDTMSATVDSAAADSTTENTDAAATGGTPASEADEPSAGTADSTTGEENGGNADAGGVQTDDDNRRYAAARRQAERQRDRAIADERARSERYINQTISELGLIDPYTNRPITTKEEYDAYRKSASQDVKTSFMQRNNLTEADYNKIVNELPEVVEARRARAEAEAVMKSAKSAEAKVKIDEQLKEITQLDKSIQSIDDLIAMDTYPKFYELVKKGNSFPDAYRLANYDKLIQQAAAAEKQRTLNSQSGKAHLTPHQQNQGQALPVVSGEVAEMYRFLDPTMTDEDIARDYAKRKIK